MKVISSIFLMKLMYFFPLFLFGIMHFIYPLYFEFLVPRFVPGGIFWVYFSAMALSCSSLAVIFNIIPRVALACLVIFVFTFIVTVDVPGILCNEDNFRFVISFLKDVSLLSGTCLYLKAS